MMFPCNEITERVNPFRTDVAAGSAGSGACGVLRAATSFSAPLLLGRLPLELATRPPPNRQANPRDALAVHWNRCALDHDNVTRFVSPVGAENSAEVRSSVSPRTTRTPFASTEIGEAPRPGVRTSLLRGAWPGAAW